MKGGRGWREERKGEKEREGGKEGRRGREGDKEERKLGDYVALALKY
jgi:hypothetical protein